MVEEAFSEKLKGGKVMNVKSSLFKLNFLAIFLVLALILAACSNDSDDPTNESATSDSTGLSGEIEVWAWNVAAAALQLAADDFMEMHPDVEITVRDIGDSDLYERMTVGMGSGGSGLPDVSIIHSDELAGYVEQFPNQFTHLGELGFDEHMDKFVDFKAEVVTNSDGEIVAMPWDIGPAAVFYRVDLFEEAGVNPEDIETWDDYIEAGKQIKDATGVDMLPIEVSSADRVYGLILNQLGGSYYTDEEEIDIASQESIQAMEIVKKMYDNDIVAVANDWDAMAGLVANGNVASIPIGVWYSGTIMDQAPDLEGKWDAFELPAVEVGGNRAANTGGSDLIIPSSTDNPELAYAFAEYFVTNDEAQVNALREYGLFPSLLSSYDDPFFEEEVEYFNNSPIFSMFSDIAENVQPSVYTGGFARAQDVIVDAQSSILLDGEDVSAALDNAADRLASETGLNRAEQ